MTMDLMSGLTITYFTYILLDKPQSKAQLEKAFPCIYGKIYGKGFETYGFHFDLTLSALKDVYSNTLISTM